MDGGSTVVGALFLGDLEQEGVLQNMKEAPGTGMIGQETGDFLGRLAGPVFQGQGEWQDCDWWRLGFLPSEMCPVSAGWQFRFVPWPGQQGSFLCVGPKI